MSQDKFVIQIKSQLGMAISRLRILQNNHTAQAKTECRGVANMIEAGKIERAKIRVENVIQLNLSTRFYELLERYCEILHARCMLMNLTPQRRQFLFNKASSPASFSKIGHASLPEPAIAEAVSTILYVAQDSGVKELYTIALLLQSRFNPEFVKSAILDVPYSETPKDGQEKVDADPSAPPVSSRCSPRVKKALEDMNRIPTPDLISLYLREIADEYELELDPRALGEEEEESEPETDQIRKILVGKEKKANKIANLPLPPGGKDTGKEEVKEKGDESDDHKDEPDSDAPEGDDDETIPSFRTSSPADHDHGDDTNVEDADPPTTSSLLEKKERDWDSDGPKGSFLADIRDDHKRKQGADEPSGLADRTDNTMPDPPDDVSEMSEKEIQRAIDALSRDLAAFPSVPGSPVLRGSRPVPGETDDEPIDPEALLHSGIEAESVFKISDPENLFPAVPSDLVSVVKGTALEHGADQVSEEGSDRGGDGDGDRDRANDVGAESEMQELKPMQPSSTEAVPDHSDSELPDPVDEHSDTQEVDASILHSASATPTRRPTKIPAKPTPTTTSTSTPSQRSLQRSTPSRGPADTSAIPRRSSRSTPMSGSQSTSNTATSASTSTTSLSRPSSRATTTPRTTARPSGTANSSNSTSSSTTPSRPTVSGPGHRKSLSASKNTMTSSAGAGTAGTSGGSSSLATARRPSSRTAGGVGQGDSGTPARPGSRKS